MQKILVTGAAGFIGFHLARLLLGQHQQVVGLDNLNQYYDVSLKQARLSLLKQYPNFSFHYGDVIDRDGMAQLLQRKNLMWWYI